LLTYLLKVPEDEPVQSISGMDYAGKSVILQFADGIDVYNSPGFPMWCLNRDSGQTKEPFVDDYGWTSCVNYTAMDEAMRAAGGGSMSMYSSSSSSDSSSSSSDSSSSSSDGVTPVFDWSEWNYELVPDILPDLHWEGTDGQNRRWALKPAEKTLIYVEINESSCTQTFDNPIQLVEDQSQVISYLQEGSERMRSSLTSLIAWYREEKDEPSHLRVHTGKLVGEAALLAEQAVDEEASGG
jgi:hypothetical protein